MKDDAIFSTAMQYRLFSSQGQ